jgi:hypothetical protein
LTLKFNEVKGAVYRLLGADGSLYLLTSKGLTVCLGIANDFLAGLLVGEFTNNLLRIPIEAADANMVDQRWLLAVGVDDLLVFDIAELPASPERNTNGENAPPPERIDVNGAWRGLAEPEKIGKEPHWEQSEFGQHLEPMASAV